MALPSVMHRFEVELSDVDAGVYDTLSLRLAKHPSESSAFLLTRLFAYLLNTSAEVELSKSGLCQPDEAPLSARDLTGRTTLWIEIGNPAPERLHKASKAADNVMIYTYKNPQLLIDAVHRAKVYRSEEIPIVAFDPTFLEELAEVLVRNNHWSVMHSEGTLLVNVGESSFQGTLEQHRF